MTSTMLPSASTGPLREVTRWYREWDRTPTSVDVDALRDSDVRSTVREWDDDLLQMDPASIRIDAGRTATAWKVRISTPTGRGFTVVFDRSDADDPAVGVPAADETSPVVRAVEDIEVRLGVPLQRLLKAAGIKRRTFYMWRNSSGVQPRVGSVGRLWALGQCVEDLESELSDVPTWLRDPHRLQLLERGNFDALVDLAVATNQPVTSVVQGQRLYPGDDRIVSEFRDVGQRPALRPVRRSGRGR